jgi:hypothetical protein
MLIFLITVVVFAAAVAFILDTQLNGNRQNPVVNRDFHVGVAFGGNTTAEAKLLIDKIKGYINLFVVQSGPVSTNETSLNEIVDYAVGANLDVIVYFGFFDPAQPWRVLWLDFAKQQWGDRFLGVYLNDEPGGRLIDGNWTGYFNQIKIHNASQYFLHEPAIDLAINGSLPVDNNLAASHFAQEISTNFGLQNLKDRNITAFTSDYALYWFDYLGGYNTIFGEFGSNQSINQAIALTRGAATLQSKPWGAIITWKYDQPPYLENGSEMYSQMFAAYMAGANYLVIFDYPSLPGNPYGILTEDHFRAMAKFWDTIQSLKTQASGHGEAVLVLPHNYGWGMRFPNDRLWGVWAPDAAAPLIWNQTQKLLSRYGYGLDIVYDDARFPVADGGYQQIYYWNQTT